MLGHRYHRIYIYMGCSHDRVYVNIARQHKLNGERIVMKIIRTLAKPKLFFLSYYAFKTANGFFLHGTRC